MTLFDRRTRIFAATLSALAGFIDALGYIGTGGYFLSFMSGNTTRLAVDLADVIAHALVPLGLIGCFVLGVVVASAVGRAADYRPAMVLGFVALLLVVAATLFALGQPVLAFAVTAAAMGAENTVFAANGEVRFGLTYMTGTLVKFGQKVHAALAGGDAWGWLPYLLLWLGLATGALAGALSFPFWGMAGLWVAAGLASLLAVIAGAMGIRGE